MSASFVFGNKLYEGALYVERRADQELKEALLRGESCHVFGPRQIGKTSLCRYRALAALRRGGVRCTEVDLLGIGGRSLKEDEFYFSLMDKVASDLGLSDAWERFGGEPPSGRWARFLREMVLGEEGPPVVIIVDEIDVVLEFGFSTADFFAVMRTAHEARERDPAFRRLSFCVLGVAAGWELTPGAGQTPLAASRQINLGDFTDEEAAGFLPALSRLGGDAQAWLRALLRYTKGHPYMIQKLGDALEQGGPSLVPLKERLAAAVRRELLAPGSIGDPVLNYADRHFALRTPEKLKERVELYGKLLSGEQVRSEAANRIQADLRLAGLAADRKDAGGSWLRIRNPIFRRVFGERWLAKKQADADRPARGEGR